MGSGLQGPPLPGRTLSHLAESTAPRKGWTPRLPRPSTATPQQGQAAGRGSHALVPPRGKRRVCIQLRASK